MNVVGPRLRSSGRLQLARERFAAFFEDLNDRFIERHDLILQIGMALLARQHVLMTGPPGTGKSALASAVLGKIVDERTGRPSVFARQFTESTVQTDLVGPIDFKTLMESGRTEHFTDEGMLGAVHAFLDEVLDGRDMLLRSTLNVLHERELKQGGKTTKGAIECALMTTNRYLVEVLEQSRESLLAFVDRIAFVAYVPKSFGDPELMKELLKAQVGHRAHIPQPPLTLQDLDELQELTDSVTVPPECSELLVERLQRLDRELSSATRADPHFIPTRYLSTRTVVRTAQLLKAACVLDWALRDPTRPLQVRYGDFLGLRLTLLLAGPTSDQLNALLQYETDPREKRQLTIIQTEREAFNRAFEDLPEDQQPSAAQHHLPYTLQELRAQNVDELIKSVTALISAVHSAPLEADALRRLLRNATLELAHRVINEGVRRGEGPLLEPLSALEQLAGKLAALPGEPSELAPWLRRQASIALEAALQQGALNDRQTLGLMLETKTWTPETVAQAVDERLLVLERVEALRQRLLAGTPAAPDGATTSWQRALEFAKQDITQLWDECVRGIVERELKQAASDQPPQMKTLLNALAKPLGLMREASDRLEHLGVAQADIDTGVVGRRLMPLVERLVASAELQSRTAVATSVRALLYQLEDAELDWSGSIGSMTAWAVRALVQAGERTTSQDWDYSYAGYREFRDESDKVSAIVALVETCSPIVLGVRHSPFDLSGLQRALAQLPASLVERLIAQDESRIGGALDYFDGWWRKLTADGTDAAATLKRIQDSRILELVSDESALVRFELEAQAITELFPVHPAASALAQRARRLSAAIHADISTLSGARAEKQWAKALKRPSS